MDMGVCVYMYWNHVFHQKVTCVEGRLAAAAQEGTRMSMARASH